MRNNLQRGLEQLRNFYIQQLLKTGDYTFQELSTFTVSELAAGYKQSISSAKYTKKISL